MDITPFLHALCAVAAQVLVGLFTGNWAYGAIAGWWLVCWSGCWLIVGEKGSCKRNTGRGAASGCWE